MWLEARRVLVAFDLTPTPRFWFRVRVLHLLYIFLAKLGQQEYRQHYLSYMNRISELRRRIGPYELDIAHTLAV